MILLSPDAVIAPWLSEKNPKVLWVFGESLPHVISDYVEHHHTELILLSPGLPKARWPESLPEAALIAEPVSDESALERLGTLRNLLIADLLCFVRETVRPEQLYGLGFKHGTNCQHRLGNLLSFHYTLANYNNTRVWNNPKFWANPQNWDKYWW